MIIKLLQLNINGIKNKLSDLKTMIVENQPHIITLNETKLAHNESISLVGYTTIKNNRMTNNIRSYGGGVMILVKNDIKFDNVKQIQIDQNEYLSIKLHFNKKQIHLVSSYIRPQAKLNFEVIELLSTENTIFIGDFNSKNTLWGSSKNGARGKLLEHHLENLHLESYKMEQNHSNFATKKKDVLQIILTHKIRTFKIGNITNLSSIGSCLLYTSPSPRDS